MKKLLFTTAIAAMLLSFTACSEPGNPEMTSAETFLPENIEYRTVEPLSEPNYYEIEWKTPSAADIYVELNAIVRGTPVSTSEVEVSYMYGGEPFSDYYMVLEFKINDVYYDKSGLLERNGSIKVLYILSSYLTSHDALDFTPEGEYILILRPLVGWDKNIYGLENIAEYNILYPKLIVEKTNGFYNAKELAEVFINKQETETTSPEADEVDYSKLTLEQVEELMDVILSGRT